MKSNDYDDASASRAVPNDEKICTGRDLAEALAEIELTEEEVKAWYDDLRAARSILKPPSDKWSGR
jgi:hypothetical protein